MGEARLQRLAFLSVSTALPKVRWVPHHPPPGLSHASLASFFQSDTLLQPEEFSRHTSSHVSPLFRNVGCLFPPSGSTPLIIIYHLLLSPLPRRLAGNFPAVRKVLHPFLCSVDHSCSTYIRAGIVFFKSGSRSSSLTHWGQPFLARDTPCSVSPQCCEPLLPQAWCLLGLVYVCVLFLSPPHTGEESLQGKCCSPLPPMLPLVPDS